VKASSTVTLLWSALIVGLVIVEFAEITHVFTLPIGAALGDPITLLFALVFTTVLAVVGAIFIGIYVSARVLRPQGFTSFEEEVLRMRADVRDIKAAVEQMTPGSSTDPPPAPPRGGGT
jgi:hypothetical protein